MKYVIFEEVGELKVGVGSGEGGDLLRIILPQTQAPKPYRLAGSLAREANFGTSGESQPSEHRG